MVKKSSELIKKYSINDVDYLIESIKQADPGMTEERISQELGYNKGYITQMRSREDKEKKPKVSPKFYNQIKGFAETLQNANSEGINLGELYQILKQLKAGQAAIKAEIRGYGQYLVMNANEFDEVKYRKAKALVDKIYFSNLPGGVVGGK